MVNVDKYTNPMDAMGYYGGYPIIPITKAHSQMVVKKIPSPKKSNSPKKTFVQMHANCSNLCLVQEIHFSENDPKKYPKKYINMKKQLQRMEFKLNHPWRNYEKNMALT